MDKLTNPEFIKAAAALATALSWPLLIIVLLWIGRNRLSSIIDTLDVLKLPGGVEIHPVPSYRNLKKTVGNLQETCHTAGK